MSNEGCVFCGIVAGVVESSRVLEDERVLAFMDANPMAPGHLLVVPKAHAPHLADLDPEDGAAMFRAAQRLTAALRASGLPCEGVNLFLADGEAADQEVFHAHLHVLPRTADDDVRLAGSWTTPPRAELDEVARRVRLGDEGTRRAVG